MKTTLIFIKKNNGVINSYKAVCTPKVTSDKVFIRLYYSDKETVLMPFNKSDIIYCFDTERAKFVYQK